jgi:tRNA pseudouridine55 synthase
VTTTTDDAEGEVVERRDASRVDSVEVESALAAMVGRVRQVPPMYSALKVDGRPLYRFARQGVEVERSAREVEIYALTLVEWQPPRFAVDVECGKGTYVRTIARDLGERLGCGAHLAHLVRTASGRFTAEEAIPLERLVEALRGNRWAELIHPPDAALLDLPAVVVGEENERRVETGSPWRPTVSRHEPAAGTLVRVYSAEGCLLGLAEYDSTDAVYRPRKSLRERGESGAMTD